MLPIGKKAVTPQEKAAEEMNIAKRINKLFYILLLYFI